MAERDFLLDGFIARAGWSSARREPIVGDASFRRYIRLVRAAGRAIVMDAPPPAEDVRPFLRVARHLRGLGLSAPEILDADAASGFLLLEDLGDDTFTRMLARGADEHRLYDLAMDALIALQTHPQGCAIDLPRQDFAMLVDEGAALFADWYLPAALGRPTPALLRAEFLSLWQRVVAPALALPPVLALRDFHIDNLLVLPDRDGAARCGLLDFQDAAIGSPAYDLVSLLEDARRDVSPGVVAAMRARHRRAVPALATPEFEFACATLGAARHARIVGLWVRLWRRDGKPDYLRHLPRTWRLLEAALAHPGLAELRRWFDAHAPARLRHLRAGGGA